MKAKFLHRVQQRTSFHFLAINDIMDVKCENIVYIFQNTVIKHRRGYYNIEQSGGKALKMLMSQ